MFRWYLLSWKKMCFKLEDRQKNGRTNNFQSNILIHAIFNNI